jgi:glycosyltransferase involved in cell wall biosynthesis
MKKIIIVLPAFNAEKTLEKVLKEIPPIKNLEVLLVDDASNDQTVILAKKLGINTISHKQNKGYGANQKTCYDNALSMKADYVVMLHPDYQYDPTVIPIMLDILEKDIADLVLGSRIRSRKEALEGGMPLYKYIANRLLSFLQNIASGQNLSEWHTGMRAYKAIVLEKINYNSFSNDFIFDTEVLFSSLKKGFRINEIQVPVRYFPEASSINFFRSCKYGTQTIYETLKYFIKKKKYN